MNRILTFHYHNTAGNVVRMAPAYYIDGEYEKVAVRINAEEAPVRDARIDIYDDGVSIFNDRSNYAINFATGAAIPKTAETYAVLPAGQNSEDVADDFNDTNIGEGSWVWCKLTEGGGGYNFSVQLELHQVSEDETGED